MNDHSKFPKVKFEFEITGVPAVVGSWLYSWVIKVVEALEGDIEGRGMWIEGDEQFATLETLRFLWNRLLWVIWFDHLQEMSLRYMSRIEKEETQLEKALSSWKAWNEYHGSGEE